MMIIILRVVAFCLDLTLTFHVNNFNSALNILVCSDVYEIVMAVRRMVRLHVTKSAVLNGPLFLLHSMNQLSETIDEGRLIGRVAM